MERGRGDYTLEVGVTGAPLFVLLRFIENNYFLTCLGCEVKVFLWVCAATYSCSKERCYFWRWIRWVEFGREGYMFFALIIIMILITQIVRYLSCLFVNIIRRKNEDKAVEHENIIFRATIPTTDMFMIRARKKYRRSSLNKILIQDNGKFQCLSTRNQTPPPKSGVLHSIVLA